MCKARDTRLDRIIAIKIAHENFSERVKREARAVAALNTEDRKIHCLNASAAKSESDRFIMVGPHCVSCLTKVRIFSRS